MGGREEGGYTGREGGGRKLWIRSVSSSNDRATSGSLSPLF